MIFSYSRGHRSPDQRDRTGPDDTKKGPPDILQRRRTGLDDIVHRKRPGLVRTTSAPRRLPGLLPWSRQHANELSKTDQTAKALATV